MYVTAARSNGYPEEIHMGTATPNNSRSNRPKLRYLRERSKGCLTA